MERAAEDNGKRIAAELELLTSSNEPTVSRKSSIFRIPNILSKHNKEAYLPHAFSFGPWHHDECNLQPTQGLKVNYLNGLLDRFPDRSAKLLELVCAVRNKNDLARQSYAGKISFSDDELVKILVLDGCFITELFLKYSNAESRDPHDPIFTKPWMLQSLYLDLILLENQIPWFVLQDIFNLTNERTREPNVELHQLAIRFLSKIFSHDDLPGANEFCPSDILHVIDLLWKYLRANSSQSGREESSSCERTEEPTEASSCEKMEEPTEAKTHLPSASILSEAGIKFKRRKSRCILDIKYRSGVVELPSLSIHYATETILSNLIAFEQCCSGLPSIFTSYAKFMNNLISSVNDFHILCSNGIISNSVLSPQDAAKFFNKICDDVPVTHFHYDDMCKKVNSYYQKRLMILRMGKCCCCFLKTLCCCCKILVRLSE
ncbi:hypothetical protein SLEP1_g27458 [Rubroshorea leprosula]|uniref:Uncharacterized protein n=1 Tax=Rubroshorea leprosula TaxID=152421 RepID=A0AAV5JWK2_9ROSI|nr:hypothetical protein SLEP1_g27458 [Rubroshorea leprosula]